jgi:hypothetical protein
LVLQIAQFVVFVVTECNHVKAEWDDNNNANKFNAMLVVRHELIKVAPQHFILNMLNMYLSHLDHF